MIIVEYKERRNSVIKLLQDDKIFHAKMELDRLIEQWESES